jgi:hypothetical protein
MCSNFLGFGIVKEVVMGQRGVVEQVHEEQLVSDETAVDEGVWEVVNWHCEVV